MNFLDNLPILGLPLTWRHILSLPSAVLTHGNTISDSVDRMISNLKTVQYFMIKLTLQLYNILGLMSVKFGINRLYIFRTMASWIQQVYSLTGSWLPVSWRDFLRLEPVRTLKLWDHSQWNLYDQKEESFLFLTNVNIMCKTSLIMDK